MPINTVTSTETAPHDMMGSAVQRREDPHLISGESEYSDDIQYPRMGYLSLLRSQYAHASIESIDTSGAESLGEVHAVFTQDDINASGVAGSMPVDDPAGGSTEAGGETDAIAPDNPLLADGKVVYQGQPLAAVVAETRYAAKEAIDLIEVDYEGIDSVIDPREALDDQAPEIHDDIPGNRAFKWETGDEAAADEALRSADNVVELDIEINRVIPTAMEPRSAVARFRSSTRELSLEMSTQNPHQVQADIAQTFDVPDHKIRVRPTDVGGGFGAKLFPYSGHLLACWSAMALGRPVKFTASRSDEFLGMVHSRHHIVTAEAGVDDDGSFRGFRAETLVPVGGYLVPAGSAVPTNLGLMASGQYAVDAAYVQTTGAYTNTTPLSAYRGAGRPEATYFIERLVKQVSMELDIDPVEFRRQNFIDPSAFPYDTGLGRTYDSGEYDEALTKALEIVGYDDFRGRQQAARSEGRYLGLGISCYVEACGAGPGMFESGVVQFKPSGKVVIKTGTAEIGTGHPTGYSQIVANELGIPFDDIEVVEGDTGAVPEGNGTGGSRAMPVGGGALKLSAEKVREKARRIAAHEFEAPEEDVEFEDGSFFITGARNRTIDIQEIASVAYGSDLPESVETGLEATTFFDPSNFTFPFGTHVVIAEVDPDTGDVDLDRYVAVDDVGTQINPKLIEGQIHGGVVQGIGQALLEEAVYDDNGNLLTASLQDYAVPKAEGVPELEWESTVTPAPHNPLGVKGVGEAGAIGAPPAVVNAVLDALEPFGVTNLDMPLSNETVWRAVQDAKPTTEGPVR